MAAATSWVTDSRGDLVPTTLCAACGKQIDENTALNVRGASDQGGAKICDTTDCYRQWTGR